jgi:hypothetical protein
VERADKGPRRCRSCQAVVRRGYGWAMSGSECTTRFHDRLRTLTEVAQPYNHRPDVAELRQRIHQTVTTVA